MHTIASCFICGPQGSDLRLLFVANILCLSCLRVGVFESLQVTWGFASGTVAQKNPHFPTCLPTQTGTLMESGKPYWPQELSKGVFGWLKGRVVRRPAPCWSSGFSYLRYFTQLHHAGVLSVGFCHLPGCVVVGTNSLMLQVLAVGCVRLWLTLLK